MTFQGFEIKQDEDGFYWQNGGYYDTRAECEESIADWNAEELRRERETFGFPEDTPSLPPITER